MPQQTTDKLATLLNHQAIACNHSRAIIQVAGTDAEKLLQGQISCDLSQLKEQVITTGHCTPKGRLLSSFDILKRQENCFWLITEKTSANTLLTGFKKYAVFFKAELTDLTDQLSFYSAQSTLLPSTDTSGWQGHNWGISIWRDAKIQNRIELIIELDKPELTEDSSLNTEVFNTPPITQTLADIRAVRAHIGPDGAEQFIPNHLNYQFIDGISFTKGCYTGQEIIARLHYKSELKKHTYHFISSASIDKPLSDSIYNAQGKVIGQIISQSLNDKNLCEFLAIADKNTDATAYLDDKGQEKAHRQALPYAITEA